MSATVRYTDYGVPHIMGDSYRELGRGIGYSFAQQHLGLLADRWLTLRGERSMVYGPDVSVPHGPIAGVTNLQSDLFWRYVEASGLMKKVLAEMSEAMFDLCGGTANGYNEFLDEIDSSAASVTDPRFHRDTWMRRITAVDVAKQALHWNMFRSSVSMVPHIVAATVGDDADLPAPNNGPIATPEQSNMFALGGDVTDSGKGMLYANPHWYWSGPDSFREMHMTLPGVLDVYGSIVPGIPVIMTGFSRDVAFAGTSSLSPRFAVYRLQRSRGQLLSYRYDGDKIDFKSTAVECPVDGGGVKRPVRRTFFESHHGLLLAGAPFESNGSHGFAIKDVAISVRWLDQQLGLMTSTNVADADKSGTEFLAVGWRNLAVADRFGSVLYADRTAIPNVSDAQLARSGSLLHEHVVMNEARIPILDGANSSDEWATDSDAPIAGIIGSARLPKLVRRDYVANANDSHWTNHSRVRLEGFPAIVGPERTLRTLRTRVGLALVDRLIAECENEVSFESLCEATTRNTVWSAVLWRDAVCDACEMSGSQELRRASDVLQKWDGCERIDSRGAILWRRFYEHFAGTDRVTPEACFSVPFNSDDPLGTPSGLNVKHGVGVIEAMRLAMADLSDIGADIAVGQAQYVAKGDRRYGVPGGPAQTGQYDKIDTKRGFVPGVGYPDVSNGSGFRLWVSFTEDGVMARSILGYSQSEDPSSTHFSDQTALLSSGLVKAVLFDSKDIENNLIADFELS